MKTLLPINQLPQAAISLISRIFITILLAGTFVFVNSDAHAQWCTNAPSMTFNNPVLISGVDGQIGAKYRFPNVSPGIDAEIEILDLHGGALLGEIDNTTQGYYDAWQPYVTAGANDTSYLEWHICFKKAGTNVDTLLPCLAVTAVDTDGDNSQLKEFIQASTPGAYAVDPNTTLTVTFDGVRNTAIGDITTIPFIDTAHREAMFQMNFENVSCIDYRNGSISTKGTIDVRHTCIYFKPFFYDNTFVILPCKLISFTAKSDGQSTRLSWSAQQESNLQYYTVQKSNDGINWKDAERVSPQEAGNGVHTYFSNDHDRANYYRLQQTDRKGNNTYSYVVRVSGNIGVTGIKCPTIVSKLLPIEIASASGDNYTVSIHTLQGTLIRKQPFNVQAGINNISLEMPQSPSATMYIINITNKEAQLIYTAKVLVH